MSQRDDFESELSHDTPPFEAWFVIEVDIDRDRDEPLYSSATGPFESREKAEHELDEQRAAWERAIDEWDGENPYDFKGWDIVKKHISDHQIGRLDRQDEESYRITMDAVNAVGASLLAKEGIGPLAGDSDE